VLGPNTITSGVNYLPLVINPAPYGATASGEIVYVTGYNPNTTTATVIRGQEGTSGSSSVVWPNNTVYAHGTLAGDFGVASGIAYGDFPAPTASGQWFVSQASGAVNPAWVDYIPTTELSGTIAASGIVGLLNNATISGSAIVAGVPATQVSGGALQSSVTISGSKVYGDLSNSTISGSRVYGNISANATVSGAQVVGNILATQISGGALQTSTTILGSQVTSAVANAINATNATNATTATTATNAGTVTSSIGGSVSVPIAQISSGFLPVGVQISGAQVIGNPTAPVTGTISGNQIVSAITNAAVTIPGAQVTGNISATQISGGLVQNSVRISGSQVYGTLSANATISGAQVTGNISATQVTGTLSNTSISISGVTSSYEGVPVYSNSGGTQGNWSFNTASSVGIIQTRAIASLAPSGTWVNTGVNVLGVECNSFLLIGGITIYNGETTQAQRSFEMRIRSTQANSVLQSRAITIAQGYTSFVSFSIGLGAPYNTAGTTFTVDVLQAAGPANSSTASATLQMIVLA